MTNVFSDVAGSTALGERLDPETLGRVMTEYFEAAKPVVERHGGVVAKFIGDAVMAVFGLPEVHEDDALRGVRTALALQEALARLNPELERRYGVTLSTRIGVNTGPVSGVGIAREQNLVAGDTANTAARLQQLAAGAEVLIGEATYRLVREAVDAELLPPVEAKGKTAPLTVYRVLAVREGAEAVPRRLDAPMIGRQADLAQLEWALERTATEKSCRLVSVFGAPGIGKSWLAQEFVARLGERATVLQGRCLPFGEGITFWPLAEMVKQAGGIREGDGADDAVAKLEALLDPDEAARTIGETIAQLTGLLETTGAVEEGFWAVRTLFARLAQARPLVAMLDDA